MDVKNIKNYFKEKLGRELSKNEISLVNSAFQLGRQSMYDDIIESLNKEKNKNIEEE